MSRLRLASLAVATLAFNACGAGADGASERELTVFAAASMQPVLTDWLPDIETEIDMDVNLSFAASSVVARQVVEGAPADVLITADRASMATAAAARVVGERMIVARNRLTMVVAPSNPRRLNSLRDLSQRELRVVLCDPDAPCGRLTDLLLEKVGVSLEPSSYEENASAAVGKVVFGQADATLAYHSDVRSRPGQVDGVEIPEADDPNLEAVYPAAVVRSSPNRAGAQKFIELLKSPAGATRLERAGFLASARVP